MNPSTPNIPESDPAYNKFCCCPWPDPAQMQPAIDNAQAQADYNALYADPQIAQSAGMGEGPAIGPGKHTITYDEALEWIADQQPRPQRPDPHLAALSRQLMKAIDAFNPAVARVLLPIVAPGSEEWTPEMIAAASDDQLKEMLVAAVAYCVVRGRWQPDNEPPEPPPDDRKPCPSPPVDRRQELRESPIETTGPPELGEQTRKGPRLTGNAARNIHQPSSTPSAYAGCGSPATSTTWIHISDAVQAVLLRLSAGLP